jgi:hypothetical protein
VSGWRFFVQDLVNCEGGCICGGPCFLADELIGCVEKCNDKNEFILFGL